MGVLNAAMNAARRVGRSPYAVRRRAHAALMLVLEASKRKALRVVLLAPVTGARAAINKFANAAVERVIVYPWSVGLARGVDRTTLC